MTGSGLNNSDRATDLKPPSASPPLPNPYRQELGQAVQRYHRPLVAYARTLLGDLDLAREAAQDTLLKLCEQPEDRFREKIEGHLAPWLFTVCRNRAIDILRKERRMTTFDPQAQTIQASSETTDDGPTDLAQQREEQDALFAMIAALPTAQREVVQLRFQAQLSYKQIAAITDQSVSYVGVLLHQAMGSLREQMKQLTA